MKTKILMILLFSMKATILVELIKVVSFTNSSNYIFKTANIWSAILKKKKQSATLATEIVSRFGDFFPFVSFQYCCNYLITRAKHKIHTSKFEMADLDDFFAKKDRKKKAVKKFATADELAKKLEDTKQKSDVRPKKERPVQEGDEAGRAGVSLCT